MKTIQIFNFAMGLNSNYYILKALNLNTYALCGKFKNRLVGLTLILFSIMCINIAQASCDPCICGPGGGATAEDWESLIEFCCDKNEKPKIGRSIYNLPLKNENSLLAISITKVCETGVVN